MRLGLILLSLSLLMATSGICLGDSKDDLASENAKLKQRVDKLENEVAELRRMVMKQAALKKAKEAKPAPAVTPKLSEADMQRILKMAKQQTTEKKPVWSNLDIQLYGRLKLDASYDTSRTHPGNYNVWVDSESTNKNDNEFNMTGNETRLGMLINGPTVNDMITSGRVEVDFYGSDAAENKAKIQLRHAYLKLDWPEERFSILAGQTSDVISPLVPTTLNYTVLWDAGNIGYRRPQIRLTKIFALRKDVDLKLEGAVVRTIGRSNSDLDLSSASESGEDAGYPGIQGRVSATFPLLGYKPTTFGVSGHWAKEEYDVSDSGSNKKFDSWSINLDLTQPINKWLTVKGEFFNGEDLDTYFGGIGQGVNTSTYKEIGSKGGWVAASLGPWEKFSFNTGVGVDDVDSGDVSAGNRTLNRSIFANVIYSINDNTQIGFELSQWHTEYKGQRDADDLRAQTSFIYTF